MRLLAAALALVAATSMHASVDYSAAQKSWTLTSGPVEYQIQQQKGDGGICLRYFGPHDGQPWSRECRSETDGLVDGQRLAPADLTLEKQQIVPLSEGRTQLQLHFRHRRAPLEVDILYTTYADTGVITRQLILRNTGTRELIIERAPSLALDLPGDDYDITYLHGSWGEERQVANAQLTAAGLDLVNTTGRSSAVYSPWFVLHGANRHVRYAAQLAYSGNWEMHFTLPWHMRHAHLSELDLRVDLGMRFDFGGGGKLKAGASFTMPEVAFTATDGDMDDAANNLHRYQREFVIAHTPTNSPPLTLFNTWQMMRRNPTAAEVKHYADLIAPLGIEALVIDSGWFHHAHTPNPDSPTDPKLFPIFGDWEPDTEYFPKGLRDVSDYVHSKGLKFGVWVEIETVSQASRVAHEHPDWLLRYNGKPIVGGANRAYLNFANPAARAWARATLERLITEDNVDWFKLDYNVNPGEMFDPASIDDRSGTVLHDHFTGYFAMLDEVRAAHPNVVLENCASGGLRVDLAILHHTHTTWTSDVVEPKRNVQLDYGCTLEFAPEVCEHWMTGDSEGDNAGDKSPGHIYPSDKIPWMETMMRLPMAGQLGFSSLIAEWPPQFREIALQGIRDYKRIRPIIASSNTFHLTPPPPAGTGPTGWMALEFAATDTNKAVVLAFRLSNSTGSRTLHLRGLRDTDTYTVHRDGKPIGTFTGADLLTHGLPVNLATEWSSALIEINRETK